MVLLNVTYTKTGSECPGVREYIPAVKVDTASWVQYVMSSCVFVVYHLTIVASGHGQLYKLET